MTGTTPALAALFRAHGTDHELAAEAVLFSEGDPADCLWLVISGRLLVTAEGADGRRRPLAFAGTGAVVGEAAALGETARQTRASALRDSRLLRLEAGHFLELARADPAAFAEFARLLLPALRTAAAPATPRTAKSIGLSSPHPGDRPDALRAGLARALAGLGLAVAELGPDDGAEAVDRAERVSDIVLQRLPDGHGPDCPHCRRLCETFLVAADAGSAPPPPADDQAPARRARVTLVLEGRAPAGAAARWRAALQPDRLHHVADGAGLARVARFLGNRAVALVLSGGGARAFAHVGVVSGLRALGVPIDSVGGTSMGAIVAAGVAAGWDDAELDRRIREAFVRTNPLDDIALPLVAMTRGQKVAHRLATHFGATAIDDLALSFFAISANLTRGGISCHDRGPLVPALRASISLPGILPPVLAGGEVLVDGGALRNLPADVMRERHAGPLIAVDVGRNRGLSPGDVAAPSLLRFFFSGAWRAGPPIVSILMRSATIASGADRAAVAAAADILIEPDVGGIEIRDWTRYESAVAAGAAAVLDQAPAIAALVAQARAETIQTAP
jgi:NTE family protein